MANYIAPDVALVEHIPDLITDEVLTSIVGDQAVFSRDDARRLMKRQFKAIDYAELTDMPERGYSRAAMLDMLQLRCAYVIRRGSTLNNPHIPASYFNGWPRITTDHAATLRDLVVDGMCG
jgi:hypothetical protein